MRSHQQPMQRGEYRAGARRKAPLAPHLLMALYGAGWVFAFDAGVRIYMAEIVSVAGLLLVNWRGALQRYPLVRSLLGAYGLWVLAIILSDIVNETEMLDSLRAMATPLLGGAGLLFVVAVLHRDARAILTFLAVTAVAKGILGESSYGEQFTDFSFDWESVTQNTNYFKVRFVPFLTPAIALLSFFIARTSLTRAAIFLFLASVVYFALDARSAGLVLFVSALALIAVRYQIRLRPGQILFAGVAAGLVAYAAFAGYITYSLSGDPEGHNARQIARMENPYNPAELLLQGRSEWSIAVDAITERPIFGHGSWAQDVGNKYSWLRLERSGIDTSILRNKDGWNLIPVHAVLVSMLLWPGILGLPAAALLLRSLLSGSLQLLKVRSVLLPVAFIFCAGTLWDFFFSPPQVVRLTFPYALGLLIVLVSQSFSAPFPYARSAGRAVFGQY